MISGQEKAAWKMKLKEPKPCVITTKNPNKSKTLEIFFECSETENRLYQPKHNRLVSPSHHMLGGGGREFISFTVTCLGLWLGFVLEVIQGRFAFAEQD